VPRRAPSAPPDLVLARLRASYPPRYSFLEAETPFQLLAAVILSAQCTDAMVNRVTPALFARWPTAEALAEADPRALEEVIHRTGFFRSKARNLLGMAKALVERHGGEVPDSMEALVALPGVGRKTANVILTNAFDKAEGVCVDTHVGRLARRLGLARGEDPVKVEQDLMRRFAREDWPDLTYLLIQHGRAVCPARSPRCGACVLTDVCPKRGVARSRAAKP